MKLNSCIRKRKNPNLPVEIIKKCLGFIYSKPSNPLIDLQLLNSKIEWNMNIRAGNNTIFRLEIASTQSSVLLLHIPHQKKE